MKQSPKTQYSYRFLANDAFKDIVRELMKSYKIYGPVNKNGFPAYARIKELRDLELTFTPTHLSAKEFLFPPKETLVRFDAQSGVHEEVVEAEAQVIIGLHACDIHALSLMDKVFGAGIKDVNYLEKRKRTIIIGTECLPDKHCFCQSLGTMNADEGFDLFLHRVSGGFLARSASAAGEALLKKTRKPTASELKQLEAHSAKKSSSFQTRINARPSDLPRVYAESDSSPVWERIGSICYGCGSCNNVCPTCYCFDVRDEMAPDLKKGERVRVWDGCTLEDFASVAGGHNFRKSRAQRLRHRFNRKFRYLSDRYNALFCVGCGRCIRTCLVNINIAEITNELVAERNERNKTP